MKTTPLLAATAVALSLFSPVLADDIEDSIKEALGKYTAGELGAASQALQMAQSQIDDKKGEQVVKLLPDAPDGWKADEPEVNKMGILGGGISVTRRYEADGKNLKITLTKDSPLVGQFSGLLANPAMAAATGMKMKKIGSETAMYQVKDGNASLTMVIGTHVVIQIEGSGVKDADLLDLAGKIQLDKIKAMN